MNTWIIQGYTKEGYELLGSDGCYFVASGRYKTLKGLLRYYWPCVNKTMNPRAQIIRIFYGNTLETCNAANAITTFYREKEVQ